MRCTPAGMGELVHLVKMARLCVAGTSGLMAPVEVSHHSWAPWMTTNSTCKPVLLVSSSCVSWQVS